MAEWTAIDIKKRVGGRQPHMNEFYIYGSAGKYKCLVSKEMARLERFANKSFVLEVSGNKFRFRLSEDGPLVLKKSGYIGAKGLAEALALYTDAKRFHARPLYDWIEFWPKEDA